MKNNSPQKHAFISCLILVTGILLVVIGAMTTKEYKINLCLLIGAIVVIGGIVYHLIMMKWVQHMNSLKTQAEEMVMTELIYS